MVVHKFRGLSGMTTETGLRVEAIDVNLMADLAGDWLTLIILEMSLQAEGGVAVVLEVLVGEGSGSPTFGRMASGAVSLKNTEMDLRLRMAGEAIF
jgi:hypothetical protein